MPPTLDDAWAKVEWAHHQLVRLDEIVKPFVKAKPYLVRDELKADGGERVIWAESPQPPPPDVPFLFGDLVHSLHSALDYVVCSLVESVGQDVRTSHAFPIFPDRLTYEAKAPKMLRYVPYEAIKLINELQPYHEAERATEHGVTVEQAARDVEFMPLMRLYRLSIEEKHRALLLATNVFSLAGTYVGHDRTPEQAGGIGFRVSPTYDKMEIVIRVDPAKPNEHFDQNFTAKVALLKEGPSAMPIESLARMLYREVAHHVLAKIKRLGILPLSRPRQLPFAD